MSYPPLNTELIQKIRQQFVEHPEQTSQHAWISFCGTTRCAGGWALALSGYKPYRLSPIRWWWRDPSGVDLPGSTGNTIADAAQELLGLTDDEAFHLFFSTTTEEAVPYLDRLLSGERGAPGEGVVEPLPRASR